jgi:FtsP/CotA-like multicopper oxidase with cupredoxin domain/plastocyanin
MRRLMLSAAAIFVVVATACSGGSASAPVAAEASSTSTFDVSLTDQLTIEPKMIDAPAGEPLTFNVTNTGKSQHSFAVLVGDQTYATPLLDGGTTATLDVPGLGAGDYVTECTAPGHASAGMKGMLMVSEGTLQAAGSGASATAAPDTMTAQEMADAHQAGVDAFVAQLTDGPNTRGIGNQPLRPTMQGGRKVFELTVSRVRWEATTGTVVDAMAFNGQVPGPQITVHPGDRVRLFVRNQMDQPFALHMHGLTVPNAMDGVPFITQDPVMPGMSFRYDFTVRDPPGMYVYHSHFNSAEQVGSGLYGALIVAPDRGWSSVYGVDPDVESTLFLGDGPLGFTLNGKGFPSTLPIIADRGDWVLVHMANDGELLHPMHLHGFHFQVVGVDGFPLSQQNRYMADTLVVAPGQRYDLLVHATQPGVWAFHCHILSHVEGPEGMFGMVTALIVQ